MSNQHLRVSRSFGIALFVALVSSGISSAQWTKVNNPPSGTNPSTCLLLTDGTVMCQADEGSKSWLRLSPDNNGSYENGTWSSLADAPQGTDSTDVPGNTPATCSPCQWAPTYYSSAVLPDGRLVFIGGEYNTNGNSWSTIGFLFDPTASGGLGSWSAQLTQPFGTTLLTNGTTAGDVGDSQSIVLQDGTMLIANIFNSNIASFDPSTLTFTALNPTGTKVDGNDEEGWTILPDGQVLTVDSGVANSYEFYDPTTNSWGNSGNTAGVSLPDVGGNCGSTELGPAVVRPDGTLIQFPGNQAGQTAVYTIATNTWAAGPTFPSPSGVPDTVPDGPASLLVNGNVLVMASPGCIQVSAGPPPKYSVFNTPSHFYEFDGTNLNDVTPSTPGTNGPNAPALTSFEGRMLLLPSGRVLFTHRGDGTDVWTYTPAGSPQSSWAPAITSAPAVIGQGESYSISGSQFNGFSQGAAYGDNAQMASNYPLVRITSNGSGHVFYARTHAFSEMGIESVGSSDVRSATFDVPSNLELGASTLVVVTNGIPSASANVTVELGSTLSFTGTSATSSDFNDAATVQAVLQNSGNPITNEVVTFVLGSGAGRETCVATTNSSGIASCSITPNEGAGAYTLSATFGGDSTYAGSSTSTAFTILHEDTALAFTGSSATTSDYHDSVTVGAVLTDPTDATAISGKTVMFTLGSGTGAETCIATTDGTGTASCPITPNQAAGTYTLTAAFAADSFDEASSASASFNITKEETTTKFAAGSPTLLANGFTTTFSATLLEDGLTAIQGRALTITIGAQSCTTGLTDATGTASCMITLNQVLGPGTIMVGFAGDAFYLASSASEADLVFAFLSSGSMVIGDLDSAVGTPVTFWGSQWSKMNTLSGGIAPSAFKGFAGIILPNNHTCGGSWTTGTGNSSFPPATLPSYMGVIASSVVTQTGSTVFSGNVPKIVVVKTNPGYSPMPSTPGTGTVVATWCQ